MSKLDPSRFPRASAYIASLPRGLDSFPEARMNHLVLVHVPQDFPDLVTGQALPPQLDDFFARRITGDWFNETVGNAIYLMIRDQCFRDDQSFQAWNQKNIDRLIRNPLFRAIMVLLSPALVVIGAGKRWTSFHQGTAMKTEPVGQAGGRLQVRGILTFPAGIYDPLLLRLHTSTFLAALVAAKADHPEVRLGQVTATSAEYLASWVK
jgi:hypothetical protein